MTKKLLRPYQDRFIKKMRDRSVKAVLLVAPPGSGKTIMVTRVAPLGSGKTIMVTHLQRDQP